MEKLKRRIIVEKQQKQWAKIVAKAWADEDFKKRLQADPASVLKEEGWTIFPEGVSIRVEEAEPNEALLVIPSKPSSDDIADISEERLAASWMMTTH